jgi:hypothetical protein
MNVEGLKGALHDRIDKFEEPQLRALLSFVEKLEAGDIRKPIDIEAFWQECVAKYGNVLKRLADS